MLQAQTQLANARADLLGLGGQRAAAGARDRGAGGPGRRRDFTHGAATDWTRRVPDVPVGVPSTLLQRRPDIAAAERRVAAANAQIGIAEAAYFPSFPLSGSVRSRAPRASATCSVASLVWSLGASLAQTVFDAGAARARVEGARAGLEQAAARYRQTVLAAFQSVEDQLRCVASLQQQLVGCGTDALDAANLVEQQVLNRYRGRAGELYRGRDGTGFGVECAANIGAAREQPPGQRDRPDPGSRRRLARARRRAVRFALKACRLGNERSPRGRADAGSGHRSHVSKDPSPCAAGVRQNPRTLSRARWKSSG